VIFFPLRKESGLRIIPHLGDWWILFGLNMLWLCNAFFYSLMPLWKSFIHTHTHTHTQNIWKVFLSMRFIIVHCHYTISDCCSSNCWTLTHCMNVRYNRLWTNEQSFVSAMSVLSTDNILMWICEVMCAIKGDNLWVTVCLCYSWEMALNISLRESFINMLDWKGIQKKEGEVNSINAYMTNDEVCPWILNGS
jgi:hypothetical protein